MIRAIGLISLLALAGAASVPAFAQHHGHGGHGGHGLSLGLHFGIPFGWYEPPHYYYPAPYYYPSVVAPPAPPVYVEKGNGPPETAQSSWYYCEQSRAYYPYVKTCAGPWQRVSPTPPSQ